MDNHELTIPEAKVQLYGIILSAILFVLLALPFNWVYDRFMIKFSDVTLLKGIAIVVIYFLGIAIHELIHGLTAIWYAKIKVSDAKFGIMWKSLAPYFHSKVPVPAGKYRVIVMMPLVLMGIIPYIIAMLIGNGWLLAFGILFIISAAGDGLILWLMRNVASDQLVQDHPEKIGLIVLSNHKETISPAAL